MQFGKVGEHSPRRRVPFQEVSSRLGGQLRQAIGERAYGHDGRLVDWRDCLVPACARLDIKRSEIAPAIDANRRRAPDSGAAMAMNSFLPWLKRMDKLTLADIKGFTSLTFDARCPTGVRGTPPHIDLIAANDAHVVAATAHGIDYLGRKQGTLAAAYDAIEAGPGMQAWGVLLQQARERKLAFRHVDVTAMVKFALGLARTFPGHGLTLLYLYWEPQDAADLEPFAQHRKEVIRLTGLVAGSDVAFQAQSFDQLWQSWLDDNHEAWLRELVAQLKSRYDMAIGAADAL